MTRGPGAATFPPPTGSIHAGDSFTGIPSADDPPYPPPTFDTTRPHPARVRNYLRGGKDHFRVDREHADRIIQAFPDIVDVPRVSARFLNRAVTHLAGEAGIRQFLDIGPGLAFGYATHQIAQMAAPSSRVVYVDNDPLVLTHARALFVSAPEGAVACLDGDVHDPAAIITRAAETLDLTAPVGLILTAVLGLIADLDEARTILRTLLDSLPPGSCLVLEDGVAEPDTEQARAVQALSEDHGYHYRTSEEIISFFDGLDLVEPGVVSPAHWRDSLGDDGPHAPFQMCGVGRTS
ncbi:SAM-dependent methyltransferase [Frankia sp. B2]|uniref:SAM-dependent methyltransferase n=1 Tax=unclassified Frankia TaxID=2632575 RepID=UPI0009FB13BC|nr:MULTISPECIES: SAM-dependent methyltransferase [unclassified Frankia]TFE25103.1 SAM-dependent methyltransferase [Frankia sp. B2]